MTRRRRAGALRAGALFVGVLAVLATLALSHDASARTARVLPWPYASVWPAAVRFLRVDEQLKIVERDDQTGYVLFELVQDSKTFQGAMELSRTRDPEGRDATRVQVHIRQRPAYVEDSLLERLEAKLKDELGPPPPPPPAPAPPGPENPPSK